MTKLEKRKMIAVKVLFTDAQIAEIDRFVKSGIYGNSRADVVHFQVMRIIN